MQRRYRYRLYPDLSQQAALARAFGCARVVFNDGLRLRQDAYAAGLPYIKDVDVQRAVITQAKRTPERAWLAEVSSVALVQSVNDLHRAYRNYFNDLARVKAARARGEKAKLRVCQPKFKAKHNDQAIRLTRNGFGLRPNGRLHVAKVGEVQVRWSRPLPAAPSSVTITLDGAGRYHASFVVEVPAEPLSTVETAVGVDLGLACFAALSTGEQVNNPRWLRTRQAALRRVQRSLSRKRKGSVNRAKACRKVTRLHVQVADARRDFHHKLSSRLIYENQTVCVETLNVAGLGRSNLAKSIHDAGWGQFVRMLAEKAERHGRSLVRVDPWYPSSQLCSTCGVKDGPKPLKIRAWPCAGCGAAHDRDINAARNLLAAGRAVTACGPGVRPSARAAVGDEAGTTRDAAACAAPQSPPFTAGRTSTVHRSPHRPRHPLRSRGRTRAGTPRPRRHLLRHPSNGAAGGAGAGTGRAPGGGQASPAGPGTALRPGHPLLNAERASFRSRRYWQQPLNHSTKQSIMVSRHHAAALVIARRGSGTEPATGMVCLAATGGSPTASYRLRRAARGPARDRGRVRGQQALDQPLLDTWRATPATDVDRAGSTDRLGELLEGAIGPSARRLVHAALVRTELLKP